MAQSQQTIQKEERSLGDLFSELATETSTLVRQEVALAQAEITKKAWVFGKQVGFLVGGGAVAFLAVLSLLTAVIIGLTQLISYVTGWLLMTSAWVSASIVTVVITVIALVLIIPALKKLRETSLIPTKTVESLKEDAEWLKDQVS